MIVSILTVFLYFLEKVTSLNYLWHSLDDMTSFFVTSSCGKMPFIEIENQLQYFFMRQRKEITLFQKTCTTNFWICLMIVAISLYFFVYKKRLKLFSWHLRDVITNLLITNSFEKKFRSQKWKQISNAFFIRQHIETNLFSKNMHRGEIKKT